MQCRSTATSGILLIVVIKFKVGIVIQLVTSDYKQILNKHYVNGVTLREKNLSFKCCWSLDLLTYFGMGFRSSHTVNTGLQSY